MRLGNIKDCKNCKYSAVFGEYVNCNSDNFRDRETFRIHGRYGADNCMSYEQKEESIQSGYIRQADALEFMLAGKAEFILHSTKTNEDFNFTLIRKESKMKSNNNTEDKEFIYFIYLKLAREKIYAGFLVFNEEAQEFRFIKGKAGKLEPSDRNIRSLLLVVNKLFQHLVVNNLDIFHVGNCGRCGKKLTTPESILTGLGPTCSKNLGIPRKKLV